MFIIFILLIIILIVLFPIRLKLTTFFDGKNLKVKLFKFNIVNISVNDLFEKFNKTNKDNKKTRKNSLISSIYINKVNLINDLINNRYKITLISKNNLIYSTEDAALTAILYGIINTFFYSIFSILALVLKVKLEDTNISPQFIFENLIKFDNKSIIKFNIVQIIIMLIIILKNIKFKGGTQKGKEYGK